MVEIGSRLPGVLAEEPTVTGTVVEQLDGALDEGARSADKVIRNVRTGLDAVEVEISVRSAGVASIQLVVPEVATKADRVIADRLADRVAYTVVRVRLIEIQPVVADRKAVEEQGRQRRWVSRRSGVDQATGGGIGIEAVLGVGGDRRA